MPSGGGARLRQWVIAASISVIWMAGIGRGGGGGGVDRGFDRGDMEGGFGGVVVVGVGVVVVEDGQSLPGGHAIFRAYPGRATRSATLYRHRGAARSPERQCAEAVCKPSTPRQCATAMRHD